jgi:hypothetical protein
MGSSGSMRMYCVRHSRARRRQLTAARQFSSKGAVRVWNYYTCSRVTLTSTASVQRDERIDHQHHYLPQTSRMAQRPTEECLSPQIGETSAFRDTGQGRSSPFVKLVKLWSWLYRSSCTRIVDVNYAFVMIRLAMLARVLTYITRSYGSRIGLWLGSICVWVGTTLHVAIILTIPQTFSVGDLGYLKNHLISPTLKLHSR